MASRSACSASPRRNRTPSSAALPVPTMIEVGVASPMAQGQAMISTATALTSAKAKRRARAEEPARRRRSASASAITAGTNHIVTRSTSAWIGSLAPCAASTVRTICASSVSAPTLRGAEAERAGPVDGAADDRVARLLAGRDRLAGDHRLVDEGRALDDLAIDRHALARPHDDDVAGHDRRRSATSLLAARRAGRGRSWPAASSAGGSPRWCGPWRAPRTSGRAGSA